MRKTTSHVGFLVLARWLVGVVVCVCLCLCVSVCLSARPDQAVMQLVRFFCGQWPPDELLNSAVRQFDNVLSLHCTTVVQLFKQVRTDRQRANRKVQATRQRERS
jgi:hypothetical protein